MTLMLECQAMKHCIVTIQIGVAMTSGLILMVMIIMRMSMVMSMVMMIMTTTMVMMIMMMKMEMTMMILTLFHMISSIHLKEILIQEQLI